ncbi:MAG: DUF4160 domain-containing protein [Clostridia bacterium]|nr:DUF4160 domain-containing protein [Clostridia bacterium]
MPVISRFYGMVIKMFFLASEHNPPHIHVVYGEYMGIIDIRTAHMIQGDLPNKALSLVQEWTNLYKDELLKMWETQDISELPPLE